MGGSAEANSTEPVGVNLTLRVEREVFWGAVPSEIAPAALVGGPLEISIAKNFH